MAEATNRQRKSKSRAEQHQDPVLAEEIDGTSEPQASGKSTTSKRANAFTELMSAKKPKPTPEPAEAPPKPVKRGFDARDGLGLYIAHPEQNPEGLVVEYDDDFVVIRDKFPKASVHLLLIPRKQEYYTQHPLHLLSGNPAFLAEVKTRVTRLKHLAAAELRRKYGRDSASDAPYQTALSSLMEQSDPPPPEERLALLLPGRDWASEIKPVFEAQKALFEF
ncbi:aprataxin-like protein [Didymella glomerata]|uniref:Aprataxin-like protein n=1 Tax=Didymella glomerata TaxID=749621 RepID=A0A9W8WRM6_9PLEO|nr:aprataxin-like protein [Didymella glomerata]